MNNDISFRDFLLEAINNQSANRAANLIMSYLSRKTGKLFWKMPGVEEFTNANGKGFGVRLFIGDTGKSIRFNWRSTSINASSLESVDIWNGRTRAPNWHVEFDKQVSLVVTLPFIADLLKSRIRAGDHIIIPTNDLKEDVIAGGTLIESTDVLLEKRADAFDRFVRHFLIPDNLIRTRDVRASGNNPTDERRLYAVYLEVRKANDHLFRKEGAAYRFIGTENDVRAIRGEKIDVVDSMGGARAKVTTTGGNEEYEIHTKVDGKDVDDVQSNIERLTYEDSIDDMESLLRMMLSGASNALFIAGRGGVGKTYTVEKVLSDLGLSDGDGYYKNTGSASAAGIYRLLYQNKDGIVMFDDSDDALKDQESRNIFKAATDTKKVRKLSWSKAGGTFKHPDDLTDEDIENGKLPTFFEFTGKIIFISNLKMDKLDPDGALRTRAFMANIDPTDEEVFNFMRKICLKVKLDDGLDLSDELRVRVIDVLQEGAASKASAVNLRQMVRGLNMMAGGDKAGIPVDKTERMIRLYA